MQKKSTKIMLEYYLNRCIFKRQMPPEGSTLNRICLEASRLVKLYFTASNSKLASLFSQKSRFRDGNPNGNVIAWGMSGARLKKAIDSIKKWRYSCAIDEWREVKALSNPTFYYNVIHTSCRLKLRREANGYNWNGGNRTDGRYHEAKGGSSGRI